jgi:hypothetical protein
MTQAEIDELAGVLKLLLRPGDVAIAEYQGKPAAFTAIFPNLNEAIRDMNGRLFPFNWIKLLWRLKVARTKTARMPMMGVRKSLQASPVGAALALSVIRSVREFNFSRGVVDSELSWILARNSRVRHVIEMVGGVPLQDLSRLRESLFRRFRIEAVNGADPLGQFAEFGIVMAARRAGLVLVEMDHLMRHGGDQHVGGID